jgi:formamidopyrimidine-DNA glycosylase
MPELPEVETIRRQLAATLPGRRLRAVDRSVESMLLDATPDEFRTALPGRRILDVRRRGKFLVFPLSGDLFLTIHLGMTGQVLLEGVNHRSVSPHDRFVFRLEVRDSNTPGDSETPDTPDAPEDLLVFRDIRKFGRVHLTWGGPAARLSRMGPDAWPGDDWDETDLAGMVRGRRAPLKALLLDQRHLAGIGNIYADEILFAAGLSPLRPAGTLSADETADLAAEIRRTLAEGVRLRGCSISDYVDAAGVGGGFQRVLHAYGRHGQECLRCGGTMERTIVAGRGTAYCPSCQS